MNDEDRARVIQGQALCEGRWVSIERKAELDGERRRRIEKGYVQFQGEWITIDEKVARTAVQQPAPPAATPASNVVINRQVYNIDNRTYDTKIDQSRHVHVDPQSAGAGLPSGMRDVTDAALPDSSSDARTGTDRRQVPDRRSPADRRGRDALPARSEPQALPPPKPESKRDDDPFSFD